jgi:hypothetical protein
MASSALAAIGFALGKRGTAGPRPLLARVIVDNDFSGDPDGLFQLAHHVLCPSVQIALIVGSHLPARFSSGRDAAASAVKAAELLKFMGLDQKYHPIAGSEAPISSRTSFTPSVASAAIVREAMRNDADGPLIYAAGAGLTDLALAWLSDRRIGRRLKLIWIGGNEHPGLATPPPGTSDVEFNFMTDPLAAQVIFNDSDIEIWQVPRDAYRQMLFGNAELDQLAAASPLGGYLKKQVENAIVMLSKIPGLPPIAATDAYVLGDSPLVTLTALVPPFQPDPSSSRYTVMPTPHLGEDCSYSAEPNGRPMRVFTALDSGLTFRDMTARFTAFSRHLEAPKKRRVARQS